jgi:hypothetical protein
MTFHTDLGILGGSHPTGFLPNLLCMSSCYTPCNPPGHNGHLILVPQAVFWAEVRI